MQIGLNYPWKSYGNDFGVALEPPWSAQIDAEFAAFKALGISALRWFILGEGNCFGSQIYAPLSQKFLSDFELLLVKCETAGIQLLPSLFDFLAFKSTNSVNRTSIITNPATREQFFSGVLRPLLSVSAKHPTAIYAWEMMNEPEWVTGSGKLIPLFRMLDFLAEGVSIINAAGFKSTVGFGMYATVQGWDSFGLHIRLHQFHYYKQPGMLPTSDFDPRWPLILGEIPTITNGGFFPELGTTNTLLDRLHLTAQRGYPITFLWACHATDTTVDWSSASQSMITQFLSGS